MHLLSVPCIAMALVNFYVGAYYLYFYLRRPQIREHLPFALVCLSVGFYDVFSAGLYNSLSILDGVFWQRLQLDTLVPISVFLIWFTSVFTQQKDNRIVQFSIAWFIVLFLTSLFAGPELTLSPTHPVVKSVHLFDSLRITYYEGRVGPVYQVEIVSALIGYVYLFYLFLCHYQKTNYRPLLLILACQVIYFFGVVTDSLVAVQLYSFVYISEYSFFFIVVAMAYTLLDRFVNLHTAFEELNVNLEQKVIEQVAARSAELRIANADLERRVEARTAELSAHSRELRLARDAAEAANRAKSAFLTIMGHELRTPLNGIFLAAEMLREHSYSATEQKQYAELILAAGHRLLQMVEGVLEYTITDAQCNSTQLDVALTLSEMAVRFQTRAAQKLLTLTFDIAPDLPALHADPHQLDRILRRLLDNALKFTPEGGQVAVKTQLVPEGVHPGLPPGTGSNQVPALQISVTDTGPGLRAEDCERIFEPFVQLEASHLAHAEGAGLGLTLARRLAEAHGGLLYAKSAGEGQGSTLILRLPLSGPANKP
jgi:signal transduction histidine kinase